MSSRSLRRDIERKKKQFLQRLKEANKPTKISCEEESIVEVSPIFDEEEVSPIFIELEEVRPKVELKKKLKDIFLKYNVGRKLGNILLKALWEEGLNVPNSRKKLLKIKNKKTIILTVNPGEYFHFGIKNQILKLNEVLNDVNEIHIDIGIDGLPLFKSSSVGLWPILGKIINLNLVSIFPIGVYCGKKKPVSINSFLHDFTTEIKELTNTGILYKDKIIRVIVRAFICDAPARSFVTGCVGHNAFHGCSKCLQIGSKIENVIVYSDTPGEKRTDEMFKNRTCPEHHSKIFRNRASDLEEAGINMVTQFPIDPMHLIDLGVMRKMLNLLVSNMETEEEILLTNNLLSVVGYIPNEFGRKPRPIDELKRWKATEYRQFLLYTGIVVLKDVVSDDTYYHFLLIHCAYRLLCCPYSFENNLDASEKLLSDFVTFFPNIYGQKSLTYNVHNLLHICECVREMGILKLYEVNKEMR